MISQFLMENIFLLVPLLGIALLTIFFWVYRSSIGNRVDSSSSNSDSTGSSISGPSPTVAAAAAGRDEQFRVVIVGAGFSGLCVAYRLQQLQQRLERCRGRRGTPFLPRLTFVVLEKAPAVGGTWWWNEYPGCACDIISHQYSYSFYPKPDWSRVYAPQAEIQRYLESFAQEKGLMKSIRFQTVVTEASWKPVERCWHVSTANGERWVAHALVVGSGGLHTPHYPRLPGLKLFRAGPIYHTADWSHPQQAGHRLEVAQTVRDAQAAFRGRRVAVIGTGASAVQLVPRLADCSDSGSSGFGQCAELWVMQRSAAWVNPKRDWALPGWLGQLFRWLPGAQLTFRCSLYWMQELVFWLVFRHGGQTGSHAWLERELKHQLRRQLGLPPEADNDDGSSASIGRSRGWWWRRSIWQPAGPPTPILSPAERQRRELLAKQLTPDYPVGCKRILSASDFWPSFLRPEVRLETTAIEQVLPDGLRLVDGREIRLDVLVFATGFEVGNPASLPPVRGKDGRELMREVWATIPPETDTKGTATAGIQPEARESMSSSGPGEQSSCAPATTASPTKQQQQQQQPPSLINNSSRNSNSSGNHGADHHHHHHPGHAGCHRGGADIPTRPHAYRGICVPGFPNLFLLLGPNTGIGHTSAVFMIECQVNWTVALLERTLLQGHRTVEVRAAVEAAEDAELQEALSHSVWTRCKSWYQTANGKISTLFPYHSWQYWWRTLPANIRQSDFIFSD